MSKPKDSQTPDLFSIAHAKECECYVPAFIRRYPDGQQLRVFANGYDVTDRMPKTRATLERMRREAEALAKYR